MFQDVCRRLGVHKIPTTLFYPQLDGMVERLNRTVKTMLSLFVEKQEDWDEHLPYVLMACRSAQHESTKLTNMLILGREVSLSLDLVVGPPGDE